MEATKGCIKTKFVINFRKIDNNIIEDMAHLFSNKKIAPNISKFATDVLKNLDAAVFSSEDAKTLNIISKNVLCNISESSLFDTILAQNLKTMFSVSETANVPQFKTKIVDMFLNKLAIKLDLESQTHIFSTLGTMLNKTNYKRCLQYREANKWDLKTLIGASKTDFYLKTDPRLVAFIDGLTVMDKYKSENSDEERISYKVNAIENLMKARRKDTITPTGLREHIAV